MRFQSSVKKAFSLIELLVVIGIVILVTGFILASYQVFNEQQAVILEAGKLVDVLRLAQKKAIAGENTCESGILTGYGVSINSANYTLDKVCSSGTTSLKTYSFLKVRSTGTSSVVFSTVYGTTTTQTITLYSFQLDRQLDIAISSQGIITIGSIY
jgi:type II secretory pathway pseudopilin PulG